MVTPRTGRPVGRPRKAKEGLPDSAPKRGRGRPKLPLARDSERYFLALVSAHIELGKLKGLVEGYVLEKFVAARYGEAVAKMEIEYRGKRIGLTDLLSMARASPNCGPRELRKLEDIERRGADGLVGLPEWKRGRKGSESRNTNVFRPIADALRHKLHGIRTKPRGDPDKRWLQAMTLAWCPCLCGEQEDVARARRLVDCVGEREYFETKMLPLMAERAAEREPGSRTTESPPEYLANLIRRTI
jgi:hypothetical protein